MRWLGNLATTLQSCPVHAYIVHSGWRCQLAEELEDERRENARLRAHIARPTQPQPHAIRIGWKAGEKVYLTNSRHFEAL